MKKKTLLPFFSLARNNKSEHIRDRQQKTFGFRSRILLLRCGGIKTNLLKIANSRSLFVQIVLTTSEGLQNNNMNP